MGPNMSKPKVAIDLDAVATVVSSGLSHTDCTLEGSLERGNYWIVAQCRYLDEPSLIRCRRRIRVV